MHIGSRVIATDAPPYVIAELGVNHDGSVDRALELVDHAHAAGADAVKLQLFETDRLLSRAAKLAAYQRSAGAADPFAMLRSLELSIEQMRPVVERAHAHRMHAIVTVFSVELVPVAQKLAWDAYKTASPDIINKPLIDALAQTGKPLIVSAGAANLDEIRECSAWLANAPHLLMQCVSSYPTPEDQASLAARLDMMQIDPNSLGYSDHTADVHTGALAVASGARILEKHLTYDRSASGPDHAASLDPPGLKKYIALSHQAFRMLGAPQKTVLDIEQDVRHVSRQSLTTTRVLSAGHALTREDITIKRPGTGISPTKLESTLGRRLSKPIDADMPIMDDHLV